MQEPGLALLGAGGSELHAGPAAASWHGVPKILEAPKKVLQCSFNSVVRGWLKC